MLLANPRSIVALLVVILTANSVGADTLEMRVVTESGGASAAVLPAGGTVNITIQGKLASPGSTAGLALWAGDLANTGTIDVDLADTNAFNLVAPAGMAAFDRNNGFANPGAVGGALTGYGGTRTGQLNQLVQIGGGQNTMNNTAPAVYPVGAVATGIANAGTWTDLATGSIYLSGDEGDTVVLNLERTFATTIDSGQSGPVYDVTPTRTVVSATPLTITLGEVTDPVHNITQDIYYTTIAPAIDAATNGDVIVLAAQTYTGAGNRDLDFDGKAITVRSSDPTDPTIVAATVLSCAGTRTEPHRGFIFQSGEGLDSIVDGLTITGGYGDVQDGYHAGGAIFCDQSGPTIRRCVLTGNTNDLVNDDVDGGAIALYGSANAAILNCMITSNGAYWAGGIECSTSTPSIRNCVIANNAGRYGGGIYFYANGNAAVSGCTISYNSSQTRGGGMISEGSSPTLTNTILWGNTAVNGNPQSRLMLGGAPCFSYCAIQDAFPGSVWNSTLGVDCGNNIETDPQFVDSNQGDYRLDDASPCIDTGDPQFSPSSGENDLDGNPRVMDGGSGVSRVDRGAYEYPLDCNTNGVADAVEIQAGTASDSNTNGLIDACEPPVLVSAVSRRYHSAVDDVWSLTYGDGMFLPKIFGMRIWFNAANPEEATLVKIADPGPPTSLPGLYLLVEDGSGNYVQLMANSVSSFAGYWQISGGQIDSIIKSGDIAQEAEVTVTFGDVGDNFAYSRIDLGYCNMDSSQRLCMNNSDPEQATWLKLSFYDATGANRRSELRTALTSGNLLLRQYDGDSVRIAYGSGYVTSNAYSETFTVSALVRVEETGDITQTGTFADFAPEYKVDVAEGEVDSRDGDERRIVLVFDGAVRGAEPTITSSDFAVSLGSIANVNHQDDTVEVIISDTATNGLLTLTSDTIRVAGSSGHYPADVDVCWPLLLGDITQNREVDVDWDEFECQFYPDYPAFMLPLCDLDCDGVIEWNLVTDDDYALADENDGATVSACP